MLRLVSYDIERERNGHSISHFPMGAILHSSSHEKKYSTTTHNVLVMCISQTIASTQWSNVSKVPINVPFKSKPYKKQDRVTNTNNNNNNNKNWWLAFSAPNTTRFRCFARQLQTKLLFLAIYCCIFNMKREWDTWNGSREMETESTSSVSILLTWRRFCIIIIIIGHIVVIIIPKKTTR